MTLISNLKINIFTIFLLVCFSKICFANPELSEELLPPGEAMYVTDLEILNKLNLGPDGEPIWCYSGLANSLLITAPSRTLEKCQLKCEQEKQRLEVDYTLSIDQLKIEIDSLNKKHDDLMIVKNNQISELTTEALKRPNDYTLWWASGGLAVGIVSTLAIMFAVR